jgi:hypothetical protein
MNVQSTYISSYSVTLCQTELRQKMAVSTLSCGNGPNKRHCSGEVRNAGTFLVIVDWSVHSRMSPNEMTSQVLLTLRYPWLVCWAVGGGEGSATGQRQRRTQIYLRRRRNLFFILLSAGVRHPPLGFLAHQKQVSGRTPRESSSEYVCYTLGVLR